MTAMPPALKKCPYSGVMNANERILFKIRKLMQLFTGINDLSSITSVTIVAKAMNFALKA